MWQGCDAVKREQWLEAQKKMRFKEYHREKSTLHEKFRNDFIAATEDILQNDMPQIDLMSFGLPRGHTDSYFQHDDMLDEEWLKGGPELMVEVKRSDIIRLYKTAGRVLLLNWHSWLDYWTEIHKEEEE